VDAGEPFEGPKKAEFARIREKITKLEPGTSHPVLRYLGQVLSKSQRKDWSEEDKLKVIKSLEEEGLVRLSMPRSSWKFERI